MSDSSRGSRLDAPRPSLPQVYRSAPMATGPGFWRRFLAFSGPGYLVAVGYMDPGNWATDIAGGTAYGYSLLSVILLPNLVAILLQSLAPRLGIASGRDLAQACRNHYSPATCGMLWVLCEFAICARDLAEVIGTAIALNLLFGIPLLAGVCITTLDVMLILALQQHGFRNLEAFVIALLVLIGACFAAEIMLPGAKPAEVMAGFVPTADIVTDPGKLFIAIGILGATVMPHNLYLHSSIVQTRRYDRDDRGKREALLYATLDSTVALSLALLINAAILIVAPAAFHAAGQRDVATIQDAAVPPAKSARRG